MAGNKSDDLRREAAELQDTARRLKKEAAQLIERAKQLEKSIDRHDSQKRGREDH